MRRLVSPRRATAIVACALLATGAGCSKGTRTASEPRPLREFAAATCLEHAGAVRARSTNDLDFFVKARELGLANDSGFAALTADRLTVDVWTTPAGGTRPGDRWILWAAHPVAAASDPVAQLTGRDQSRSFVMFAMDPSLELIDQAQACFGANARTP